MAATLARQRHAQDAREGVPEEEPDACQLDDEGTRRDRRRAVRLQARRLVAGRSANAETHTLATSSRTASLSRSLRASATAEYPADSQLALRDLPWRGELTWGDRPLGTCSGEDLIAGAAPSSSTPAQRQHREPCPPIARAAFGARAGSPALTWEWMSAKVQSEGKPFGSTTRRSLCARRAVRSRRSTRRWCT